jgi:hypothetical protein
VTATRAPVSFDLTITPGDALRWVLLQSHYRTKAEAPTEASLKAAMKTLRRLALACEPSLQGPPVELVETLCNDLNTPGALALLARYRAERRGRDLWAGLRFLGFFGHLCLPDEVKTLPPGHPWQADYIGPVPIGEA